MSFCLRILTCYFLLCAFSFPSPSEENGDRKGLLRAYIQRLRGEQRALKLPPYHPKVRAGIEAGEAEEARKTLQEALPSGNASYIMEKAHLLEELQAARGALAELKGRLHMAEKEKQRLGLQTYTLRSQEAAFQLMVQIIQEERDELQGKQQQQALSSGESSPTSSSDSEKGEPMAFSKARLVEIENDLPVTLPPVTDFQINLSGEMEKSVRLRTPGLVGNCSLAACPAIPLEGLDYTVRLYSPRNQPKYSGVPSVPKSVGTKPISETSCCVSITLSFLKVLL
nr:harmonin-binding protein USHBP1-like [Anolis sagrei ordinatus]